MKKIIKNLRDKLPSKAQVSGAIHGVIGDKVPKRFATEMAFYADGKPVPAGRVTAKHAVIFIHGSADTELGWLPKPPAPGFGNQLENDFGIQSFYLRYNSGLAVSDNGEKLSALLQDFCSQKIIRRVTLIAHSMGGLVAHSAVYHARAMGHEKGWLKKLRQVFLLGTPHTGAPLAQIAEKGEQILQFIPNPVTLIAASVIGLRSRGLKDLSRGQSGLPAEGKILQPRVKYVFIAGGVQKKQKGIMNRLIGDGMVRGASAVQEQKGDVSWLRKLFPWFIKSAEVRVENLPGVNHLALRTSAEVYAVIRKHFQV